MLCRERKSDDPFHALRREIDEFLRFGIGDDLVSMYDPVSASVAFGEPVIPKLGVVRYGLPGYSLHRLVSLSDRRWLSM